jgi:ribosomal-protein-alanine N-acetyltransferase
MTRLTTSRLLLREWREEDREPFARMNADPLVMRYFPDVLSRRESDEGVDRVEAHFAGHGFGLYATELQETGEFIGFIGLNTPGFEAHFTPCVEIGWRLAAPYWNRGLATKARARCSGMPSKLPVWMRWSRSPPLRTLPRAV